MIKATKEDILGDIEKLCRTHLNCKFNPEDYCEYDAIHETQIPFLAKDIFKLIEKSINKVVTND